MDFLTFVLTFLSVKLEVRPLLEGHYFRVFTLLKLNEALRATLTTVKHLSNLPSLNQFKFMNK